MSDPTAPASETSTQPAAPEAAAQASLTLEPAQVQTPTPQPNVDPPLAPVEPAKPVEPAAAAPVEPAAPIIPETYDLKLPEGIKVDPALLPALTPALKAAKLTGDQFQKVAESFIEFQKALPERMLARDLEVTMKDPALGGLNYGQTQANVNRALSGFTTPEFRGVLQRSGLANNLEFVRTFERIGRAMAGDTAPAQGPEAAPETSRAQRLYSRAAKVTS
jgi:hypothetical protein